MVDAVTDALVSATYPSEWARAKSKGRNKLRKRYRTEQELKRLRADGAECGNCKHIEVRNMANGWRCGLESDFHGDVLVETDCLCVRWSQAQEEPNG